MTKKNSRLNNFIQSWNSGKNIRDNSLELYTKMKSVGKAEQKKKE